MKVYALTKGGIRPAVARAVKSPRGRYFSLLHGEEGRGRWQYRLPLAVREFPCTSDALSLEGADLSLVDLRRKDAKGNDLFLLVRASRPDARQLVLWYLSPGYRGGASYRVEGAARVIASGHEAQGDAGRMGGADCPVVLVDGPCQLSWHRTGRLYGDPADWVAVFDGDSWTVAPQDQCTIDEAAYTW